MMHESAIMDEMIINNLTFQDRDVQLGGRVHVPATAGPHPAVVFVDGSGPGERDGWWDWPERFGHAGIASLAYDKPGCGESSGDWREQTLQDRAVETLAAAASLARQPRIDPDRIALLGMSQGGWVAPLAATLPTPRAPAVAAVVALSTPGVSPLEQETYRIAHQLPAQGFSQAESAAAAAAFHDMLGRIRSGDSAEEVFAALQSHRDAPWFPYLGPGNAAEVRFLAGIYGFEPAPVLERLTCPVLALWGADDLLVPVDRSVDTFDVALRKAGNANYRLQVVPGADHGLSTVEGVGDAEPDAGAGRRFAPGAVETLTGWLRQVLGAETPT
jgi:uncharacterized protein